MRFLIVVFILTPKTFSLYPLCVFSFDASCVFSLECIPPPPHNFGSSIIVPVRHCSCATSFLSVMPFLWAMFLWAQPSLLATPQSSLYQPRSLPCVRHFMSFRYSFSVCRTISFLRSMLPCLRWFFLTWHCYPVASFVEIQLLGVACLLCLLHFFVVCG